MNRRWILMPLLAALLALAGCGAPTSPADSVPALATQLARVDATIAERNYAAARKALDALTRETTTARNADKITAEQAQRILVAVARLTADLPAQASTPRPTVTIQAPPSQSTEAETQGADDQGDPSNNTVDKTEDTDKDKGKNKDSKNEIKKKKED